MIPPTSSAARRTIRERLDYLAVADPEAARRLGAHLTAADPRTCAPPLARIVDDVVEALALEVSFGRRLAEGMGRILAHGTPADLERYRGFVQAAAASGPTLGSLVACHFVPVLIHGDADLADRFAATTRVMLQKGTYTLKAPLETLSALIQADDRTCARAFLDLLAATYAQELSYNRTVYLTHTLPRAVDGFDRTRRLRLIRGLTRVIQEDDRLADDYIQGCAIGLQLLSEAALEDFLDQAIRCHRKDPERGGHFLSLGSHRARQVCRDLQITVPLASVRPALERYARARTGMAVPIRPLSALPATCFGEDDRSILVYCDGRSIHLPDEMGLMNRRADNIDLYKLLVKLEVGAIEFGTCELDADKALGDVTVGREGGAAGQRTDRSDLGRFLDGFADPEVALDLFTLFEHARLARNVKQRYPGLHCRLSAALDDRALQARAGCEPGGTLYPFYRRFVMDAPLTVDGALANVTEALCSRLAGIDGTATAAASARLAAACYPRLAALVESGRTSGWQPLRLPFGRRLHPDAFAPCDTAHHRLALDIQTRLAQRGLKVYRSDIRELLDRQDGRLTPADLRPVIVGAPAEAAAEDLAWLDLESLTRRHALEQSAEDADGDPAYRYREWDGYAGDYLPDRVRVRERMIQGADAGFYRHTLDRHHGLVKRIRYAFELLRPQEITLLRQWREGDAFDYRALLDYAVDRKAGLMPSDRLFVKRIKRIRDVAALLLVDLSRSTANAVDQSGACVLDVEKQAIVLLGEALEVVGDRFAIAGFSGTGPLGVDYYRIKGLQEPFDDAVKGRISAMAPLRSTRMGAAIRHAAARLAPVSARVRLLLILGDGYPNDLAYKGDYAVEDTRRAVMEARAEAIHVKAITVNAGDNGKLDRLYGKPHHTLIGNIRDLPDKLVRVYSALTRH